MSDGISHPLMMSPSANVGQVFEAQRADRLEGAKLYRYNQPTVLIDFHAHVFPPRFREQREDYLRRDSTFAELYSAPKAKMATAPELIQAMDESEIDLSVVMGIGWRNIEVAREANDYIIDSMSRYPRRLAGFCSTSPAWGDQGLKEMERCAKAGLKGVGELHPDLQGFDLRDQALMAPFMAQAQSLGLVLLTHASEPVGHDYQGKGHTTPEVIWPFLKDSPKSIVVLAHWGGGLPFYSLMPEVKEALKRVYFDTAASPFLYDSRVFNIVSHLVEPEKVLFGTDFPLMPQKRLLGQVKESGLDSHAQALILGENAQRLLSIKR